MEGLPDDVAGFVESAIGGNADDAFRIDSYLCMGNTRWQLYGDETEIDRAGRLALEVIAPLR